MRILVTGGAGFIGSNLCRALLAQDHEVICLDNLFSGLKSNIQDLRNHPKFEFIRHDVVEPIMLEVDQIYNLACPASPPYYQQNPIKTVKTNVMGAINMLELAKYSGARILQASTSEVYGDPLVHPQQESYFGNVNPVGVRSCYDEGKRVAETLFRDYQCQHDVDIRIARIFNTYGPYMRPDDGRVVSNFIMQLLRDEPITIYGDGSQTRSFCYVQDLVDGLMRLMNQSVYQSPVNIGNPGEFTLLELLEVLFKSIQKMGYTERSSLNLKFMNLPSDDPKQRQPDISLMKTLTGWEPRIDLNVGIPATIAWFVQLHRVSQDPRNRS